MAKGPNTSRVDRHMRLCRAEVIASDIHGETVMIDAERGLYFGLDAIGSDIWARLQHGRSVADLAAELAHDYSAPVDEIERDISLLLDEMLAHDLIRPCD